MKKVIALLLALLIIVPLTACTAQQETPSTAPSKEAEPASAAPSQETATEKPAEEITLTMWTIATESDSHHEPYLKSIADYEASHPGIKIQMETFENESYKTKIKAAVAAKELPDIFFTWSGGFSTAFVQSGAVLPVDDVYANYQDQLPKSMLGNLTWDGKIYGTGYTMNVSMLFYNKTMFAKYNLNPPTTYDELVNVCKTFTDNGVTPFGISAKDTWVLAQTHDQFTLKSVGAKTLQGVLTKSGTDSYNSPDFVTASADFANLVKIGAYSDNAVALSNDEACATFYSGEVPMYIMGSWMCGSILTDAPNPADFGVVPVPVINSSNAAVTDFMGGPSDSLMVSSTSQYPKEAAEAMFEIAKGVSHYGYLAGCGLPAWAIDYDDSSVNPLTQEVAKYVADATSFTLWFDTLMEAEDTAVYLESLQQLYLGDITPEEFCKTMGDQLGS
jgi:raffinose/stachyose/melibiose transport system substrate-binding protein